MKISLIAAVATNGIIGNKYSLPWRLPEDLRYFREKTWGKAIILGNSTFQSLPVTLDNRKCIVLSRQQTITGKGDFQQAISEEHALRLAKEHAQAHNYQEILIAGGSQVYNLFFKHATVMYITEVDIRPEGDAYFPTFDTSLWSRTEVHSRTSTSGLHYKHLTYQLNSDSALLLDR